VLGALKKSGLYIRGRLLVSSRPLLVALRRAETLYLTLMRTEMLGIRDITDNRKQPYSHFMGQKIVGCSEYHTGSLSGECDH
jgi:hypothetical protein